MNYVERAVQFGLSGHLVGVLTKWASTSEAGDGARPAVLFWNVGLHHHVGPFRIYTDLARHLASLGFVSLRFDLSGLGDSDFSKDDNRSESERGVGDIQEAMELVTKETGIDRFVVIGFCSSVDPAHEITLADPRVVGAIFIEGYSYTTPGYYLRYPGRALSVDRWVRWLYQKGERFLSSAKEPVAEREQVFLREYPTPKKLASDYDTLLQRGVKMLMMFVGGESYYVYEDQLFDAIGSRFKKKLEIEFMKEADHTFSLVAHRKGAIDRIGTFLEKHFR